MRRGTWLKWILTGAVVIAGLIAVIALSKVQRASETELVYDAVKNAALSCYAVEGAYPASVGYLREHYGLLYDEERYIVSYDAFASNILPAIRVLEKGVSGR